MPRKKLQRSSSGSASRSPLRSRLARWGLFLFGLCAILGTALGLLSRSIPFQNWVQNRESLADYVSPEALFPDLPGEIELHTGDQSSRAIVQYSIDHTLQSQMEELFRQYRPDHGAFVAIDPSTGRILSLLSYSQDPELARDFAFKASYPAASVFKVVTASAAIAAKKVDANSIIPYNGANHTLYRRNVMKDERNRWTRMVTLKEAFGRSINTVFAKVGAFFVGREALQDFANRFGFNRAISRDLPVERGIAMIPQDTWGIAEAASGYTREITMSPIQGGLIAASIANDGVMMEPFVVHSLLNEEGQNLYQAEPRVLSHVMDPDTAREVRHLMEATVSKGTSSRSFRGFRKTASVLVDEFGGKTGSLTGTAPRGKYDWFVGYAMSGSKKIAVCVLTVHQDYWRVKSSYLARRAFEAFLKEPKRVDRGGVARVRGSKPAI